MDEKNVQEIIQDVADMCVALVTCQWQKLSVECELYEDASSIEVIATDVQGDESGIDVSERKARPFVKRFEELRQNTSKEGEQWNSAVLTIEGDGTFHIEYTYPDEE